MTTITKPVGSEPTTWPSGVGPAARRRSVQAVAGLVVAAAVVGAAAGAMLSGGSTTHGHGRAFSTTPVRGEFRLGPGNAPAPGIAVPLAVTIRPVPGEFRLGPGNDRAPGITVPLG